MKSTYMHIFVFYVCMLMHTQTTIFSENIEPDATPNNTMAMPLFIRTMPYSTITQVQTIRNILM